jgi:hypothetical protein
MRSDSNLWAETFATKKEAVAYVRTKGGGSGDVYKNKAGDYDALYYEAPPKRVKPAFGFKLAGFKI